MADFDAAGEDNLLIHDGFTYRDLDVDEKTSCKVSTKEAYIHLLKQHGALVPCDGTLRAFVLQDFNEDMLFLKVCTM